MMTDPNQTQNYRVRHSCGHYELRRMRESTAGVPWTPTATVQAHNACNACAPRYMNETRLTQPTYDLGPDGELVERSA